MNKRTLFYLFFLSEYHSITPEATKIIFKSEQSLLWHKDEAWMEKGDGDVDLSMGSYDGAETCDLVGLFFTCYC